MAHKHLHTTLFPAWNTYAVSMMSVLEDCGMWETSATFQRFLAVTGIAASFRIDRACTALPVTDYDWLTEHRLYTERIGVKTKIHYAAPDDSRYDGVQEQAIADIKNALDEGRSAVAWGIDTGEFGILDGYDDEDGVFFAKGIGSIHSASSVPILYRNLGKNFEPAPILYVEIPISRTSSYREPTCEEVLRMYCAEMRKTGNADVACGIAGYDMLIAALKNRRCDSFGLRYCAGIYHERKEAMLRYLGEEGQQGEITEIFREIVTLYRCLTHDLLAQDENGWNHLWTPVTPSQYPEILSCVEKIKAAEQKIVDCLII